MTDSQDRSRDELFARQPRTGWWTWGNEIGGEDNVAAPMEG